MAIAASVDVVTLPVAAGPDTKRVLHLGTSVSTPTRLHPSFAGWHEVRLDSDPAVNPDIVGSPVQMSKVPTGSMDAVYSYHGLQLLQAYEVPSALSEIKRVLKLGGHALLGVLDLTKIASYLTTERFEEMVGDSASGSITVLDMLYGNRALIAQGKSQLSICTGFTAKTFGTALVKAGFSEVRVQTVGMDVWAQVVRGTVPATAFNLLDPAAPSAETAP